MLNKSQAAYDAHMLALQKKWAHKYTTNVYLLNRVSYLLLSLGSAQDLALVLTIFKAKGEPLRGISGGCGCQGSCAAVQDPPHSKVPNPHLFKKTVELHTLV
jgi:hypothetical protein